MIVKVFLMALFILAICSQRNKEGNNELLSMKRNACLLTTRNYLHSKQDNLEQILKGVYQSEMKQYLEKLHAALIQKCEKEISESEAQEFYAQNNDDFDIANFFYLVSDASFVDILSDLTLTWEEKEIIEFSKAFDKHHKIEQVDEQEF